MNAKRKIQLIIGGVIAALIVTYFAYGSYQKRQLTRAVVGMVTDTAARLGDALQSKAGDPSDPEAAATQEQLEKHLVATQEHLARVRAMDGARIRPLAETAYEYVNTSTEILRRIAASNAHRIQLAVSLQALGEHMTSDNHSGPWVSEAIRRKERLDRDFRDYRRAVEALAQLLGDYAVSRQRMAGFVDAALLPPDEAAEQAKSRALATLKTTAEEVEKARRLDAYR